MAGPLCYIKYGKPRNKKVLQRLDNFNENDAKSRVQY